MRDPQRGVGRRACRMLGHIMSELDPLAQGALLSEPTAPASTTPADPAAWQHWAERVRDAAARGADGELAQADLALGVQLHVILACPSKTGPDPAAYGGCDVVPGSWRMNWSEEAQMAWLDEFVPMIASKPAVTGVFLSSFGDSLAHRFPHSGVLRPDGTAKSSLEVFQSRRHAT